VLAAGAAEAAALHPVDHVHPWPEGDRPQVVVVHGSTITGRRISPVQPDSVPDPVGRSE
jgi:hypothetical protein